MEVRCRIVHSLRIALSPEVAPYLLDREVSEPDPHILGLNAEMVFFDETVARFLRERETSFIRSGLGLLINTYLVRNGWMAWPMNDKGSQRMQLNILVLQQNLKNVEEDVDLARASNYYALFDDGPDAVIARAKADKERQQSGGEGGGGGGFGYDELKALVELCFSEQVANPERGIAAAGRRRMDEKLQELSEHVWHA